MYRIIKFNDLVRECQKIMKIISIWGLCEDHDEIMKKSIPIIQMLSNLIKFKDPVEMTQNVWKRSWGSENYVKIHWFDTAMIKLHKKYNVL